MERVDWSSYAYVYDMILAYNPAYKELLRTFSKDIAAWEIEPGALLADFGAGTGNFSLQLARQFPKSVVLHIDKNPEMNDRANAKAISGRFDNLRITTSDVNDLCIKDNSLAAFSCMHALYAFSEPKMVLSKMWRLLRPGGYGVICDLGRIGSLLSWSMFFANHLVRENGMLNTVKIFVKGREVFKQNRTIRQQQIAGTYWTHQHGEFCKIIVEAGFNIQRAEVCYRGNSDYIVLTKV